MKRVQPDKSAKAELTIKSRFPAEYIKDLNATDAAIRAGATTNRPSAGTIAWRWMRDPEVQAEIQRLAAERAARVEVSADTVLRNLLELSDLDPADAFDDDGAYRKLKDIPRALRRCIASIRTREEVEGDGKNTRVVARIVDLKFNDNQMTANIWLGKHLRLFIEQLDLPNNSSLAKLLAAVAQREKAQP